MRKIRKLPKRINTFIHSDAIVQCSSVICIHVQILKLCEIKNKLLV